MTGTAKDPNKKTLWEHAEEWWVEQGKTVPKKNTPEYEQMYEEWVDWAFDFLRKKKGVKHLNLSGE